jgi:hypothetical protein
VQLIEERLSLDLTQVASLVRRLAADWLLDDVELSDPFQRLARKRRCLGRNVDVVKLAPHMRPTRSLADPTAIIEAIEPGIAVGLQDAMKRCEMGARMQPAPSAL